MKFKLLLPVIAFLLAGFSVSAQTFSIKGNVVDSTTQKGIDFITVALKLGNNQPVKSVLSKSDGDFVFEKLAAGKYKIAVVGVGYRKRELDVDVNGNIDLGKITIAAATTTLKEVTISADRPLIKQEVDRIAYDIQADPESKVNSVLDMMRKVPLLSLDADDNIKLQGNGNFKILINGKPSSMVARNPKDVLKSMPASTIQKIEVITTPPAKYDSEGLAGIINIITTRKIDNGYNASINARTQFPVGGPGGNLSFTVKQGKFGASGYGGIGFYNQPQTTNSSSRITTGTNSTDLTQTGFRESENRHGYMGTEYSFEIDSLNLITAEVGYNNGMYNSTGQQISLLNNQQGILQGYNFNNRSNSNWNGWDLALNYQLGFKSNKNRLLTFSYKLYNSDDDQDDDLKISNRVNYSTPDYKQANESGSREQTIQLDYVHPVKKLNIEAGLKGILRDNNSDFFYSAFNANTGNYEIDNSRTNQFKNHQDVLGAYNSYQYNLKDWGFKAGVRIEGTLIDADFISTSSEVNRRFFNIIPSVSVNRKFKDMSSLNFGFTQRIQRPSIWNLNPFVNRYNPNFESTGNPDLRPVVSNNIQMRYSKFKKGSFNIGLNYNFANNTIQSVSVYDPLTNVTRSTYGNIGKDRNLGSNFNINYPITKKWDFSLNGNLGYVWLQGMINGRLAKNDGMRGYFGASTGYKFEKGWRVNAYFSYSSPYISLQGQSSSYQYSSFSLNKEVIKDKLTFSASTSNPFNKFRNYISETSGADFIQSSNFQNYLRSYNVNLNYRFGKLKGQIKKSSRKISNDDVSGGRSTN